MRSKSKMTLMEMLAKNNLSSFDDLVFEYRNKSYGAYAMRKGYNRTMAKAFTGMALLLIMLLFVATRKPPVKEIVLDKGGLTPTELLPAEPDKKVEPEKKDAEPAGAKPADPVKTDVLPILSPDGLKDPDPDVIDPDANIGDKKQDGKIGPVTPGTPTGTGTGPDTTGDGGGTAPEKPLDIAEVMPKYPGGDAAMNKFIALQAHKNNQWADMGLTGKVFVRFVVNADGSISSVEAVKGNYQLLKKIGEGAVKAMPNWIPGMQGGRAVPVILVVPIDFKLN